MWPIVQNVLMLRNEKTSDSNTVSFVDKLPTNEILLGVSRKHE